MKKHFFTLALAAFSTLAAMGQTPDPVLFYVEKTPVTASEFKYIYAKTNQEKADFSEASLREYLDLYEKFKLKVYRAKDMKLDTIPALKSELEGYRRTLANSYLVDKEVTDRLIRETYDRSKKDVEISHIFFQCDKAAKPADTLIAFNRAMDALKKLAAGEKFDDVAIAMSDDKTVKESKGRIGWVSVMFPDGFYSLELAAWSLAPGEVAKTPVRTANGYHILRLDGSRDAFGEVEVAQILIRRGENPEAVAKAKTRIDSIYMVLQAGANWDALCAAVSDDKMTAAKGGLVGSFGINRYQKAFEDAAFALAKNGDYCSPIETTLGFHIIKRLGRKGGEPFEKVKRSLAERVKRDSRSETAKQSMIARIRRDGGFQENAAALQAFSAAQIDSVFLTYRWKPAEIKSKEVLFSFANGISYSIADFEDFLVRAGRQRMKGMGTTSSAEVVGQLYKGFVEESVLKFEETQLDKKYPEFKNLMREYEEGILLFDATKQLVWDKANQDSTGLEAFFNQNLKGKYQWEERATLSTFIIKTDDAKLKGKILKAIGKKPTAAVLKKFNKTGAPEVVLVSEKTWEKSKLKEPITWQAGWLSEPKTDEKTKATSIIKVEKLLPVGPKSLGESRGYAVADYQDFLEKQWVDDLKKMYKITVDEKVLMGMVGKRP